MFCFFFGVNLDRYSTWMRLGWGHLRPRHHCRFCGRCLALVFWAEGWGPSTAESTYNWGAACYLLSRMNMDEPRSNGWFRRFAIPFHPFGCKMHLNAFDIIWLKFHHLWDGFSECWGHHWPKKNWIIALPSPQHACVENVPKVRLLLTTRCRDVATWLRHGSVVIPGSDPTDPLVTRSPGGDWCYGDAWPKDTFGMKNQGLGMLFIRTHLGYLMIFDDIWTSPSFRGQSHVCRSSCRYPLRAASRTAAERLAPTST